MRDSFHDLLFRNPRHRFTEDLLKAGLMQVFLALDYLHTECKVVHTGATVLVLGKGEQVLICICCRYKGR